VTYYKRRLPHWHPEGADIFLTWRLHGAPAPRPAPQPTGQGKESTGRAFVAIDRVLDRTQTGPTWLKNPQIADIVISTIKHGANDLHFFDLHAYVIMPNHVHLLISPRIPVPRIMQGIKGTSSRQANLVLKREGTPFWHPESFDHWVRNAAELTRIRAYIETNPVSAGLVKTPEAWPWSSATAEARAGF
jgi:putative transposase